MERYTQTLNSITRSNKPKANVAAIPLLLSGSYHAVVGHSERYGRDLRFEAVDHDRPAVSADTVLDWKDTQAIVSRSNTTALLDLGKEHVDYISKSKLAGFEVQQPTSP
jgi:hypothetical protein